MGSVLTFLVLCSVLNMVRAIPSSDATRDQTLTYYKQCARVDGEVVDPVLDMFISTINWVNNMKLEGRELPSVGWLSPSDASDLGWSYNLHIAGQAQQRCFGVKWYPVDNVDEAGAAQAMVDLINIGVKLIMATSAEFVSAVPGVALANPDTMFVIPFPVPDFFSIPNIRAVSMNVYEGTYLAGYVSESMTPEDVEYVGVIGAISFMFTEMQNMNAFYFGMMDAAADMGRNVHKLAHWWTESYSDRDRTIYAVQDIAKNFDVKSIGQTPDRYESQAWLRDNGFYGTGATGDMGQFLGPTVLTSTYVGWDVPGLFMYGILAQNDGQNWGNSGPFIFSSVWLGSMGMGTPSVLIPSDVLDRLNQKVAIMKSHPFASWFVWCGERVQDILPEGQYLDNVTGCMTVEQSFMLNKLHPDIDMLGSFQIPVNTVTKPDDLIAGQFTLVAIGFTVVIIIMIYMYLFREDIIATMSGKTMTFASLIAALIAFIGLALYIPDPDRGLCMSALALYAFGFYALFAFFMAKVYGFILVRRDTDKMQRVARGLGAIMPIFVTILTVGLILIIVWLSVDNPGSTTIEWIDIGLDNQANIYYDREVCTVSDSGYIISWFLMGYALFLVILTLIGSYLLSAKGSSQDSLLGANPLFDLWKAETRNAFMVCLVVLLCAIVAIGASELLDGADQQTTKEWAIFIAGFLAILGTLFAFYGPKVWTLIFRRKGLQPVKPNTFFDNQRNKSSTKMQNVSSANMSRTTKSTVVSSSSGANSNDISHSISNGTTNEV